MRELGVEGCIREPSLCNKPQGFVTSNYSSHFSLPRTQVVGDGADLA